MNPCDSDSGKNKYQACTFIFFTPITSYHIVLAKRPWVPPVYVGVSTYTEEPFNHR